MKLNRSSEITRFNRLTRILQRAILNQFKLTLHKRKKKYSFLSKEYNEQMITIIKQDFNLIHCRCCKKFSKASQGYKLRCTKCAFTDSDLVYTEVKWAAWKNSPFT